MMHFQKSQAISALPSNYAGDVALGGLLRLTKGGRVIPTPADYLQRQPEMSIRLEDILYRIDTGVYCYRQQLLQDLIAHLFWRGRTVWKPFKPTVRQWRKVVIDSHKYLLPSRPLLVPLHHLPPLYTINCRYQDLLPAGDNSIEDAVFAFVIEILQQQPGGDDIAFPPLNSISEPNSQCRQRVVFTIPADAKSPIFSDEEIAGFAHDNRYLQSIQRFSMLLKNQYFWCNSEINRKKLPSVETSDRVIVYAKRDPQASVLISGGGRTD